MSWRKWFAAELGVPVVTVALTMVLIGYALRFGCNAPVMDEWDVTPQLRASVRDGRVVEWVLTRHNEHHYPAARAVYATVMAAAGYDFRWGMVVSAGALGAASLVFAAAARRVRGRAAWADLVVPALLLNWGAGFNVLMAYQVAFTLAVSAAAFAAWVVVSDRGGRRWDLAASLALVALTLNGTAGLCLAAPFAGWVLWRSARSPRRWAWTTSAVYLPVAAVAAYGVWAVAGGERAAVPPTRGASVAQFAAPAAQFLAMGLGTWVTASNWPAVAGFTVAGYAGLALALARAVAFRPADRLAALGLGALVLGTLGMAAGVAWGRGGGLVERYASLSAAGLAVGWLVVCRWVPGSPPWNVGGLAAAVALVAANAGPGERLGKVHRMYYRELEASVRAGLPPSFAADRFRGPLFGADRFRDRLEELRDLDFATFRELPPEPPTVVLLAAHFDPPRPPDSGPAAVALPVPPGGGRKLLGVRVGFETDRDAPWLQLRVAWTGADGFQKMSTVYPRPGRGAQTTTFYLDDRVSLASVETLCPEFGFRVTRVEWLGIADTGAPPAGRQP